MTPVCLDARPLPRLAPPLHGAHPLCPVSSSVPDDYIGRRNLEHVETLQENPVDPNLIVIGYGRGLMVIWNLEKQKAVQHIPATQVTGLTPARKYDRAAQSWYLKIISPS